MCAGCSRQAKFVKTTVPDPPRGQVQMYYTPKAYASLVVARYGAMLELLNMWQRGDLKFVKAGEDDIRNAKLDPKSVHPNPSQLEEGEAAESVVGARSGAQYPNGPDPEHTVTSSVFRCDDLSAVGQHVESTRPVPGQGARRQRIDTKRARVRISPYEIDSASSRLPKRGLSSHDSVLSDVAPADVGGEQAAGPSRRDFFTTNDPIHTFFNVA